MIKFPLRARKGDDARFAYIVDAIDNVIAGGISHEDAEELVRVANLGSLPPRTRARKQKIEDTLRESDLTAQATGRTDISYGHHESLPRGEHVANLRKKL